MKRTWLFLAVLVVAGPALAVGLGPLRLDGVIDGPREGFALDLYNPYSATTEFVLQAVGPDDEIAQPRVTVLPAEAALGAERRRRVLVVVDDLAVGETYHFRVCAQRREPPEGSMINARVCSKLSAHRVA